MELKAWTVTIDSGDSEALSDFYAALLGWKKVRVNEEYIIVAGSEDRSVPWLTFQEVEGYTPPVWPLERGRQQTMAHLDFHVEDIPAFVEHALACGARLSPVQEAEEWRVMLDPAGHPFCVCPS
ncbi:MAG: VOC family protein [Oscillospiraceae bacterium]|nr:VOC family protein [Oscillospiraceae bacterium]